MRQQRAESKTWRQEEPRLEHLHQAHLRSDRACNQQGQQARLASPATSTSLGSSSNVSVAATSLSLSSSSNVEVVSFWSGALNLECEQPLKGVSQPLRLYSSMMPASQIPDIRLMLLVSLITEGGRLCAESRTINLAAQRVILTTTVLWHP